MDQPNGIPVEAAQLLAAIAFRRDVVDAFQRAGRASQLSTAMAKAGAALAVARGAGLGTDPAELYRNMIDVVVAVEDVAVRLRVANPEMRLAA